MKSYRRIEITAFHRRILIGTDRRAADGDGAHIQNIPVEREKTIDTRSDEGREILFEAMQLLQSALERDDQSREESDEIQ